MPPKDKVIEELHYLTETLSVRSRTLAGGIVALCWLLMLANITQDQVGGVVTNIALLPALLFSLLSLLMDLMQYVVGIGVVRGHLRRMESQGIQELPYDRSTLGYRLRVWLFWGKVSTMAFAVVAFAFVVARAWGEAILQ